MVPVDETILVDVRDSHLTKTHEKHIKSMHNFLGMYSDFSKKRAEIERQHSKQLNELYDSFTKQSDVLKKEVQLPTLLSSWDLILTELKNETLGSKNLSQRLSEEISKPLFQYHESIKARSKRMWKDRADEEAALKALEEEERSLMKESSELFKRSTVEVKKGRNPILKKDVQLENTRQDVQSKIAHNKYLVANAAVNSYRKQFWEKESEEMMILMQNILYTRFIAYIQNSFKTYGEVLRQYAQGLPENIEDIFSSDRDGVEIGTEHVNIAGDIQSVVEYLQEVGHVPFVCPESKPFESQNSYGVNLVIDEQTLYSLSHTRNSLLQKTEENQEKMRKKQEEVEALARMSCTYATDPDLGNEDEVQENMLSFQKELRHCQLENAKNLKSLKIFDAAGINSGHCHTHNFQKTTLVIAKDCSFCGEQAGGIHAVGRSAVSCKVCKTICHEGFCAGSLWKGCKNDNIQSMLDNIVSVPIDEEAYEHKPPVVASKSVLVDLPDDSNQAEENYEENYQENYQENSEENSEETYKEDNSSLQGNEGEEMATAASKGSLLRNESGEELIAVNFDYEAQSEYELSACEGDTAIIHERVQADWCKCTINGTTGVFPVSYLEFEPTLTAGSTEEIGELTGNEMVATYDYEAQNEDEITFSKGDLFVIITEDEDGWTEGQLVSSGEKGFIPSNYLSVPE